MKNKGKSATNKEREKNKDPADWMEKALLEYGIDERKEREKMEARAEKFKNNQRIAELQAAWSVILQEVLEKIPQISEKEYFEYVSQRLKELGKEYETHKAEQVKEN